MLLGIMLKLFIWKIKFIKKFPYIKNILNENTTEEIIKNLNYKVAFIKIDK
jgi:hypothetical protein